MFSELPDYVFDIVFVNQVISFHDRGRGTPALDAAEDSLLVLKGYLGIGDQEGWKEGMGCPALLAPYPLDAKGQAARRKLHISGVMAIQDQTPLFSAGAFHHVELEVIDHLVIKILRKFVAIFKENCYHCLVCMRESYELCAFDKGTGSALKVGSCLFLWYRTNDNIKSS